MSDVSPIVDCPGYYVGRDGSVWSNRVKKGMVWVFDDKCLTRLSPRRDSGGYLYVVLRVLDGIRRNRWVHILVLETFVGSRPEGYVARHFPDQDTSNNKLENLSWATLEQNMADKLLNGTHSRGIRNPKAKLTLDQVDCIRSHKKFGYGERKRLAESLGVSTSTIDNIRGGRTWAR